MWASLASWIVHDGQFDDLAVGSVVRAGLTVSGRLGTTPAMREVSPRGRIEPADADSLGAARRFSITGVATEGATVRAGNPRQRDFVATEFGLEVGDLRFKACALGVEAAEVPAGQLVTVEGELSVTADYEFEHTSVDMSGVVRSWTVQAIEVQQYEVTFEDEPGGTRLGRRGRLLECTAIHRAVAWEDERRFMSDVRRDPPSWIDFYYRVDLADAR